MKKMNVITIETVKLYDKTQNYITPIGIITKSLPNIFWIKKRQPENQNPQGNINNKAQITE